MSDENAKKNRSEEIYIELKERIVEGHYAPGVRLPPEREISEAFQTNRGSVREAIQRLIQASLVSVRPGGGITVLDFHKHGGVDLLSDLIRSRGKGDVNIPVLSGVLEMRAALSVDAAGHAAERRTELQAARIDELVSEMTGRIEENRLPVLLLDYWELIIDSSANIAYRLVFNSLRRTYTDNFGNDESNCLYKTYKEAAYVELSEAIVKREPARARALAKAISEHLNLQKFLEH